MYITQKKKTAGYILKGWVILSKTKNWRGFLGNMEFSFRENLGFPCQSLESG